MKLFLFDFRSSCFLHMRGRRPQAHLIELGILCLFLVLTQSCATAKIEDGTFVQESKGYSFILPGADWAIDKDAWVHEDEFGYVLVKKKKSRYILRRNRRNQTPRNEIEIRFRPPKTYEKLILDMDIGFQHKNRPMKILIGTISVGGLIKFLKGNFLKTDSDLPENLIAGYMERIQFFHPPRQPVLITSRKLPHAGQANRLEWDDGRQLRVLYGIALTRKYLFFLLQADKKTPASDFQKGLQALDGLVETSVRLKKN